MAGGGELFLCLKQFGDKLLALYDSQPDFVMPTSRLNEVRSFVAGGLKDIAVSRTTFDWGVPVPGNDRHVMYVWLDALTNYVSALGDPTGAAPCLTSSGREPACGGQGYSALPRCLLACLLNGGRIPLPHRIFAHGWWTNEGQKISKSLGNAIDPYDLIQT